MSAVPLHRQRAEGGTGHLGCDRRQRVRRFRVRAPTGPTVRQGARLGCEGDHCFAGRLHAVLAIAG